LSKWISKEEKEGIKKRVKLMRDRDKLTFRIIAGRLGISVEQVRAAYYKWK